MTVTQETMPGAPDSVAFRIGLCLTPTPDELQVWKKNGRQPVGELVWKSMANLLSDCRSIHIGTRSQTPFSTKTLLESQFVLKQHGWIGWQEFDRHDQRWLRLKEDNATPMQLITTKRAFLADPYQLRRLCAPTNACFAGLLWLFIDYLRQGQESFAVPNTFMSLQPDAVRQAVIECLLARGWGSCMETYETATWFHFHYDRVSQPLPSRV